MLFCNFLQYYLVKRSFLHEEYTRGTIFLFVEWCGKTMNLVLYTQIPAIPKFKCNWFALICFFYIRSLFVLHLLHSSSSWKINTSCWNIYFEGEIFVNFVHGHFIIPYHVLLTNMYRRAAVPSANAPVSSLIIETWKDLRNLPAM